MTTIGIGGLGRFLPACAVGLVFLVPTAGSQCTRCPGANSYKVLYAFSGSSDATGPWLEKLFRDALGNLYGTTQQGGSYQAGAVFKVDAAGNETVLYSFKGTPDGSHPLSELAQDSAGNLYGTTENGGISDHGTVFKIDTAGQETVLYRFTGAPDGDGPQGGLILDEAGNLYGTTIAGGASNYGTVFKLDTTGKETVLHSFVGSPDGESPFGTLVQDAAGNLYGSTDNGGIVNCTSYVGVTYPGPYPTVGCGTVFKLDPSGNESVLYSFRGSEQGPDGAFPVGSLVLDGSGNVYGTTTQGGAADCTMNLGSHATATLGCGTVFKLDTIGNETLLHSFVVTDGQVPEGGLAIDGLGNLYGTAYNTLFELDTSGNLIELYAFSGGADGGGAYAGVLRDASGNLYGTTTWGGDLNCGYQNTGCGTVFELLALRDFTVSSSALTPASIAPGFLQSHDQHNGHRRFRRAHKSFLLSRAFRCTGALLLRQSAVAQCREFRPIGGIDRGAK